MGDRRVQQLARRHERHAHRDDPPLSTSTTCRARWSSPTRRTGARTRRTPTGRRRSCSGAGRGTANCSARAVTGPAVELIDTTYAYGFRRRRGVLPPDTFGGYPAPLLLARLQRRLRERGARRHACIAIKASELRVHDHAHPERPVLVVGERDGAVERSPWTGAIRGGRRIVTARVGHREREQGAARLARCQASDGTLIVGRGVPDAWLTAGKTISVTNFPAVNGRRVRRRRSPAAITP